MAASLKERMAMDRAVKEQRRAERMSEVSIKDGAEISRKLASGKQINRFGLERMKLAVRTFREGGAKMDMAIAAMTRGQRAMYRLVESEFQGEWMGLFERLVAAIPRERVDEPFRMTWDEWQGLGRDVGMNEEQIVAALRVLLVFRDR